MAQAQMKKNPNHVRITIDGQEYRLTLTPVKKRPPVTHIGLVLDGSGSMTDTAKEVVSGVNKYLETLRSDDVDDAFVTISAFGSDSRLIVSNEHIDKVADVQLDEYYDGGMTALNDSVMEVIDSIAENFASGDKVFISVYTDGHENASKRYYGVGNPDVKERIKNLVKDGWIFVFNGADMTDQQASSMANTYGISLDFATGFSKKDTQKLYSGSGTYTHAVRTGTLQNTPTYVKTISGTVNGISGFRGPLENSN